MTLNKAVISDSCLMNVIGGLSNEFYRRLFQWFYIGGSSNGFQKQKSFVLKTVFIHCKCMCEGVGEDSRHGAWHLDIHVERCMFLLEWV